jgi:uncharacterized protein YjeT (DUF2065 family)
LTYIIDVKSAIFGVLSALFCLVVIAAGALQCFAPRKLKEVEDRLRPKGEWCATSGGGRLFEKLREGQARRPSVLYRLSGLALMAMGVLMLVFVLGLFRR